MGTGAGCSETDTYANRNNPYFTVGSLQAIEHYIQDKGNCFAPLEVTNQAPSRDASAANGMTIPARSAFVLEGSGSDPNDLTLLYNWEQYDTELDITAAPTETAGSDRAPLFRSFAPGTCPA